MWVLFLISLIGSFGMLILAYEEFAYRSYLPIGAKFAGFSELKVEAIIIILFSLILSIHVSTWWSIIPVFIGMIFLGNIQFVLLKQYSQIVSFIGIKLGFFILITLVLFLK